MKKIVVDNDCWVYQGYIDRDGYAIAYRRWYKVFVGGIPEGTQLDHTCNNRACVNPGHLEPVTPSENVQRSLERTPRKPRKTHCKRGHEFNQENTYLWVSKSASQYHHPSRFCKKCNVLAVAEYTKRKLNL